MKHSILKSFLCITFLLIPIAGSAINIENNLNETLDISNSFFAAESSISVQGNKARIVNAQGEELVIFDITGKKVASFYIDSNDKTIVLNLKKGCYILKVNKITRKVLFS